MRVKILPCGTKAKELNPFRKVCESIRLEYGDEYYFQLKKRYEDEELKLRTFDIDIHKSQPHPINKNEEYPLHTYLGGCVVNALQVDEKTIIIKNQQYDTRS